MKYFERELVINKFSEGVFKAFLKEFKEELGDIDKEVEMGLRQAFIDVCTTELYITASVVEGPEGGKVANVSRHAEDGEILFVDL